MFDCFIVVFNFFYINMSTYSLQFRSDFLINFSHFSAKVFNSFSKKLYVQMLNWRMFSVKGFLSSIFGTLLSIHVSYASLDSPQACNFIKKDTPTQVFSCALCEIFKNTLLREHLLECSFCTFGISSNKPFVVWYRTIWRKDYY